MIGFVFAINNEINSGEVFGSSDLFKIVWPKLLRSAAIEAISESDRKVSSKSPTLEQVGDFLAKKGGTVRRFEVLGRIETLVRESATSFDFESRDRGMLLRRSYVSKSNRTPLAAYR